MSKLILHSGAQNATRAELARVVTPAATASWQPIPHATLLDLVTEQITGLGLTVVEEKLGLTREGARFFGTLQLGGPGMETDVYRAALGLRNSHDKSFPAGLATGESVFVCDNLSFHATIVLARKHTTFIMRDLPRLVADAFGRLTVVAEERREFIGGLRSFEIDNRFAHDFILRAVDAKVIPVTKIPGVIEEWRHPSFEDFEARTLWSLYNAFTYVTKAYSDPEIARRTQRLTGLASLALKGNLTDAEVSGVVVVEDEEEAAE